MLLLISALGCGSDRTGSPSDDAGADVRDDVSLGTSEFDLRCAGPDECASNLCVPDPTGENQGTCAGPCSSAGGSVCTSSANGCLFGWFRWQLNSSTPIYCRCTAMDGPDEAGGGDTDCDAVIDEDAS